MNDSLAEFSYNANIAGLTYKLVDNATGLVLATSGYNDKMPVLLEHILDRIKNLNINPERLEVMKEQVRNIIVLWCPFDTRHRPSGVGRISTWASLFTCLIIMEDTF